MWFLFVVTILCICVSIGLNLKRYASSEVEIYVYVSVAYAWLVGMSVIGLIPIDVWTTIVGGYSKGIGGLWQWSYWSTQVVAWVLVPIMQQYSLAGDFTPKDRLKTSIKANLKFGAIVGALLVVFFFLMLFFHQGSLLMSLPGVAISLSNAFGLGAGIFLLCFGLVNTPKKFWVQSDHGQMLKQDLQLIGKRADDLEKSSAELDKILDIVQFTHQQMNRHDPLMAYMEKIYQFLERTVPEKKKGRSGRTISVDMVQDKDLEYVESLQGMASLNCRTKRAVASFKESLVSYQRKVRHAIKTEEIIKFKTRHTKLDLSNKAENRLQYQAHIHPYVMKSLAVIFGSISICILWGEATLFKQSKTTNLSVFSRSIYMFGRSQFGMQLAVLLPLVYMCSCVYTSLFSLGMFRGFYHLVPGNTSAFSLLVNASLTCRFAAPVAYNFLNLLHVDDAEPTTQFHRLMAGMDAIPFFGGHFNQFWPLVGVIFSIVVAFSLWNKIAALLGAFGSKLKIDEEEEVDVWTERGKSLLMMERDAQERGLAPGDVVMMQAAAQRDEEAAAQNRGLLSSLKNKITGAKPQEQGKSEATMFLEKMKAEREKDPKAREAADHKTHAKRWLAEKYGPQNPDATGGGPGHSREGSVSLGGPAGAPGLARVSTAGAAPGLGRASAAPGGGLGGDLESAPLLGEGGREKSGGAGGGGIAKGLGGVWGKAVAGVKSAASNVGGAAAPPTPTSKGGGSDLDSIFASMGKK